MDVAAGVQTKLDYLEVVHLLIGADDGFTKCASLGLTSRGRRETRAMKDISHVLASQSSVGGTGSRWSNSYQLPEYE